MASAENISFVAKRETIGFINDFVKHRDEEIKVRINGTYTTLDFSLTDEMKNEILDLYALYDDGRGTRDANLRDITYTDSTSVYKNGKLVDGGQGRSNPYSGTFFLNWPMCSTRPLSCSSRGGLCQPSNRPKEK